MSRVCGFYTHNDLLLNEYLYLPIAHHEQVYIKNIEKASTKKTAFIFYVRLCTLLMTAELNYLYPPMFAVKITIRLFEYRTHRSLSFDWWHTCHVSSFILLLPQFSKIKCRSHIYSARCSVIKKNCSLPVCLKRKGRVTVNKIDIYTWSHPRC